MGEPCIARHLNVEILTATCQAEVTAAAVESYVVSTGVAGEHCQVRTLPEPGIVGLGACLVVLVMLARRRA